MFLFRFVFNSFSTIAEVAKLKLSLAIFTGAPIKV